SIPSCGSALISSFTCFCAHRYLHSFPTRRSSDLGSMADAEDLAQETFIQAYIHLGEFRREAQAGSWLYRIAVNGCLNWHKRQRRDRKSTRLNSSHVSISYAVFCLKKKKNEQ